jgi:hypothetical protein
MIAYLTFLFCHPKLSTKIKDTNAIFMFGYDREYNWRAGRKKK